MARKKIIPMTKEELLRKMGEEQIPFQFEEQENPVRELGVMGIYYKGIFPVAYAVGPTKEIARTYLTNDKERAYGCVWKWMKEFTFVKKGGL